MAERPPGRQLQLIISPNFQTMAHIYPGSPNSGDMGMRVPFISFPEDMWDHLGAKPATKDAVPSVWARANYGAQVPVHVSDIDWLIRRLQVLQARNMSRDYVFHQETLILRAEAWQVKDIYYGPKLMAEANPEKWLVTLHSIEIKDR